ncbi:MAG: AmmeMemoRadiSam system protein B [Nanoarchaeota archaeon]|nr:AmmeMemoRadiSam system protein B [Nanoarchaeota archaeon]
MKKNKQLVREPRLAREPAVAGSFYPADRATLSGAIDEYLNNVKLPEISGNIKAIIVPHAGYEYSGQVAAYAYKSLVNQSIKRVILIGNSHQEYLDGISVWNEGYFKTPLGEIEIDEDFANKLITANAKIVFKESAHLQEHSLEVQLPFLQRVLSASSSRDWKIVPIILGNQGGVDILIDVLKNLIDENTLIIASSDLSHYPNYKDAQYSDNKVIQAILTGKRENLEKTISDLEKEGIDNLQTCACGADAIEVVMGLLGNKNIQLLKSANSGDVTGDKTRVVGYASIAFIDPLTGSGQVSELSKDEQKTLLNFARQAVETYVKTGNIIETKIDNANLNKYQGAFVTLEKDGELRGCIGTFNSDILLYKVVIEMAVSAAVNDSRFSPVAEDELKDLEYEISALSPLRKINSWKEIEIGKHGVEIKQGSKSGVFLPQVATENNWDLDTFMSVLCTQKAGLPTDCWKDPKTEIYVFTADVFK